ncbi:MAG: phycobilisome linker polypeptide [Oscillatoriales cyanobacterium SM2_1_8]|nr:phycobilisome linker polypeptide [Oscillatoriales cyanobacterium SM2_1_8]
MYVELEPMVLSRKSTPEERDRALRRLYEWVLERQPYDAEHMALAALEKDFRTGKIGVRHFLEKLATSDLYLEHFYFPYSNLKFVELCFKHFLGRAPHNMAEVETYAKELAQHGPRLFVKMLLDSEEYRQAFGNFGVPYPRSAARYHSPQNFQQSQLLREEAAGRRGRALPALVWQKLGLVCESGHCYRPEPSPAIAQAPSAKAVAVRPPASTEPELDAPLGSLLDELQEFLQML